MSNVLIKCLQSRCTMKSTYSVMKRVIAMNGNGSFHSNCNLLVPRGTFNKRGKPTEDIKSPLALSSKYKVFDDSDSTVIIHTSEEKHHEQKFPDVFDEFEGINLKRGINGVFEIEELVALLRRENAKDLFVAAVPLRFKFVEHICIVTSQNSKHMLSIAEFIRKVFKRKRNPKDEIPRIEGTTSKDWMALDLGNIALHIFSSKARQEYDLEQLWSVGIEYDSNCHVPDDDIIKLLEEHSKRLDDLKPAKW